MSIAKTLNQDFFKTWTQEMAYVLGYFAADGSMLRNSRGAHFIEFTTTDRVLFTHIQKIVQSNHKISTRQRKSVKWKTQYRLQIGSKEWFADLEVLGFTQNKSSSLRFPKVPKKFFGDFVRGYFDGDGCVHFKEYWSKERKKNIWVFVTLFTSGSRSFLDTLHVKLLEYGIKGGRIGTKESGHDLVLSRHDSLALYRLMYHTAEVSDLYLPRKRGKLEEAIKVLKLGTYMRV